MGRSKELGKKVDDLTPAELLSEQARCKKFVTEKHHPAAIKDMAQRLRQINKRLTPKD